MEKPKPKPKTYKTIKWVLKQQIEAATKTLWTWEEGKKENFTCIYENYNDTLTIYTPQQLLDNINGDDKLLLKAKG